ncbi:MAG: PadR family transcriptional regulator [Eubacteriales bacterium]
MGFDKSQMMRGTLEGCILKVISRRLTYGYEIMEYLKMHGFEDISEGTLYPLLLRLEKQGNVKSELLPSPLGPKRKYFSITEMGRAYLSEFEECWTGLAETVHRIISEDAADE